MINSNPEQQKQLKINRTIFGLFCENNYTSEEIIKAALSLRKMKGNKCIVSSKLNPNVKKENKIIKPVAVRHPHLVKKQLNDLLNNEAVLREYQPENENFQVDKFSKDFSYDILLELYRIK